MNSTQAGKAAEHMYKPKSCFENSYGIPDGQENEIPLFSCVCHEPQSETGVFIYYKCYPHSQIGLT